MTSLQLNIDDVETIFSRAAWQRGSEYQRTGHVKKYNIRHDIDRYQINSQVLGTQATTYTQTITIHSKRFELNIHGYCSCPTDYNCKHVAAVLQEMLLSTEGQKKISKTLATESLPMELNTWLLQLDQQLKTQQQITDSSQTERLFYVLQIQKKFEQFKVELEFCTVQLSKKGGYSSPTRISLEEVDEKNGIELRLWAKKNNLKQSARVLDLTQKLTDELFIALIETQRCHVQTHMQTIETPCLQLGEPCQAKLIWSLQANATQVLTCDLPEKHWQILLLQSAWYYDAITHTCGKIETDIAPELLSTLLSAPPLKPIHTQKMQVALKQRIPQLPLPKLFERKPVLEHPVVPHLHFSMLEIITKYPYWSQERVPTARLSFCYGSQEVDISDTASVISLVQDEHVVEVKRQFAQETQALTTLFNYQFELLTKRYPRFESTNHQAGYLSFVNHAFPMETHLQFFIENAPSLRAAGWKISCDPDYPYQMVEVADEWYSDIEESSYDWFNVELGVKIDGKTINVLPLIMQALKQFTDDPALFAALPDDKKLFIRLPDNRLLPIPVARIRSMLSVLTELYDETALTEEGRLRLHRLRAAQMVQLEEKLGDSLQRLGSESLRNLGQQFNYFQGIKQVPVPENFRATLRPYQQEGLSWLQFLREYNLAGILADDMGLGKTVQTLAHILIEKNNQRLDKPCLVIAPTSLMVNWQLEAERFAPDLRVLVLQGIERKQHYDTACQYDVILTTYPLLSRDQACLLKHEYHLLILDEAQIIKNPKAQATQIVHQLKARHRLCLTGTPLENHLGELWSLYHFLLPGLLTDNRQFKRLFRNPIEKNNDTERRLSLMKRIAPFLLRRTKQAVVKDLPPKTEILRMVELENKQRDLYESIRLAMHEKVQQVIKQQGFNKSHIVILDALLKLRQICCDPRLLKLETAKNIHAESAKLMCLREMLPSLVAEGRRILLFSQFTEMLALIETEVQALAIPYVKLTGQTQDRATPVHSFQAGEVPLFLISLKAGGVGLNLTAADTVIHYDPWWNPAVENQATDRAHRIGQDKPVFVYKLLSKGTVEEKILTMQQKKQALLDGLFTEESSTKTALSVDDLKALFEPLA